jgi:hypothetical protein
MSKYGHRTINWFEAIVNKLGGEEAAERFLRDELAISEIKRAWHEEDGVIYFDVTSDGTTGEQWIARLKEKGYRVGDYASQVLRSSDFVPTTGVTTRIGVIKGEFFADDKRITKLIRAEADGRDFQKPHAEVACLIREKFTDEEIKAMGLTWIVAMHEPIKDADGHPFLLSASRFGGGWWLRAYWGSPDFGWGRASGFAFAVPHES